MAKHEITLTGQGTSKEMIEALDKVKNYLEKTIENGIDGKVDHCFLELGENLRAENNLKVTIKLVR